MKYLPHIWSGDFKNLGLFDINSTIMLTRENKQTDSYSKWVTSIPSCAFSSQCTSPELAFFLSSRVANKNFCIFILFLKSYQLPLYLSFVSGVLFMLPLCICFLSDLNVLSSSLWRVSRAKATGTNLYLVISTIIIERNKSRLDLRFNLASQTCTVSHI